MNVKFEASPGKVLATADSQSALGTTQVNLRCEKHDDSWRYVSETIGYDGTEAATTGFIKNDKQEEIIAYCFSILLGDMAHAKSRRSK